MKQLIMRHLISIYAVHHYELYMTHIFTIMDLFKRNNGKFQSKYKDERVNKWSEQTLQVHRLVAGFLKVSCCSYTTAKIHHSENIHCT